MAEEKKKEKETKEQEEKRKAEDRRRREERRKKEEEEKAKREAEAKRKRDEEDEEDEEDEDDNEEEAEENKYIPIKIKRKYPNDIVRYYHHRDVLPRDEQFKQQYKTYNDIMQFNKYYLGVYI